MKRPVVIFLTLAAVLAVAISFRDSIRAVAGVLRQRIGPRKTVEERVREHGEAARARLRPHFERVGLAYPPARLVLVGFKSERRLEVYAGDDRGGLRFVRSFPILAASGDPGPKLREGDHQVPEGIYPVESLNPNSAFHLSLRIGYPNAFDRAQAETDGRTKLGGDIMIHGNAVSDGCLAMGDEGAEDLFVLAADAGLRNIAVVLSPHDFRVNPTSPVGAAIPAWSASVYAQIRSNLNELPSSTRQ